MKQFYALIVALVTGLHLNYGQLQEHWTEKVYGHTDRPLYFPGETIWFKAYVTGLDEKASSLSEILIAELRSPKGTVVETKNLYISDGGSYGEFKIAEDWVGGRYELRLYTNYQKNFGEITYFKKEIVVQKVVLPKLLMKLEMQQEAYGKGAIVNAELELKDLENVPLSDYLVKTTLLIQGQNHQSLEFKTNAQGIGLLRFELPEDLNTADVVLSALIPYKGSTESVSRSVPIVLDNIDLQFLPEGGQMLSGFTNTVAFKALNEFGKPADVRGVILNESQQEVARFDSYHDGMGTFEVAVEENEQLFARIEQPFLSDSLYQLPKSRTNGVQLGLIERQNKRMRLRVRATENFKGRIRVMDAGQKEVFKQPLEFKGEQIIEIEGAPFGAGIHKVRLENDSQAMLSERLVFIEQPGMQVELEMNRSSFGTRDLVELNIRTKDAQNRPISGNVSVAVVDNKLLSFANDKQDDIKSYFLMSSELNGRIHEPAFYFDSEELKAPRALDLLMLTHGWRSYAEVPRQNLPHKIETSSVITGFTVTERGKRVQSNLYLIDNDRESPRMIKTQTNERGSFNIKVPPNGNYKLIAYRDQNKPVKIKDARMIKVDDLRKELKEKARAKEYSFKTLIDTRAFNKQEGAQPKDLTIEKEATVSISLQEDAQALSEVVVAALGYSREMSALGYAVNRLDANGLNQTANSDMIQTLQGQMAGVQITEASGATGSGSHVVLRGLSTLRGNSQPLFVVDGVPFANGLYGDANGSLKALDPSNIESIYVLKGFNARNLYGSRGANGVVLISTKDGAFNHYNWRSFGEEKSFNYAVHSFRSYAPYFRTSSPSYFYRPNYEGTESYELRNDFRNTIFWNPVVQTDSTGLAKLDFYTSDAVTSFRVDVQGISTRGTLGRAKKDFNTSRPLIISSKIPAYLSVGDTLELPVTISNNGEEGLWVRPKMVVSKKLQNLGQAFPDSLYIEAGGFANWPLKLLALFVDQNHFIELEVREEQHTDGVFHNLESVSPYFPVQTTLSGFKASSFSFDRTAAVPGTTSIEGKIYLDIAAEVLSGAEGLLRMPYGCFEQTSSANYPNILILQHLQETKKYNPRLKNKANNYLRRGYRKLGSFEAKGGGFSWFGRGPASARLTAYGLLQLHEMKKVYPKVDTAMIGRSTRWLLAQRDSVGGFHKGVKYPRHDRYKVFNAYVVYCLSEVGLTEEIETEYRAALKEAYLSKDPYRMALLALSSHKRGETAEFERLAALLLNQIKTAGIDQLEIEGTVTYSYWNSKKLETAALITLTLLKNNMTKEEIVEALQFILSNRRYGRFGSTQSTALSLKALMEYSKTQKNTLPDDLGSALVTVNGKRQKYPLKWSPSGVVEMRGLEDYLGEGNQQFSLEFTNSLVQLPYSIDIGWESRLPRMAEEQPITLTTSIVQDSARVGDVVRLSVKVSNTLDVETGMVTAMVGIPSGLSLQPYQLKELMEKNQVDYYEVMDNRLVLYWISFDSEEQKTIGLDLKAEFSGTFIGSASAAYLYYGDEYKSWVKGCQIKITP